MNIVQLSRIDFPRRQSVKHKGIVRVRTVRNMNIRFHRRSRISELYIPLLAEEGNLEFRHFGLRFLNKSLSFSRNLRPAWMRQTFRTDSCAAASAYPARRGGGVAIFSILAVERNDAFSARPAVPQTS